MPQVCKIIIYNLKQIIKINRIAELIFTMHGSTPINEESTTKQYFDLGQTCTWRAILLKSNIISNKLNLLQKHGCYSKSEQRHH